jgi:hypothetical protein
MRVRTLFQLGKEITPVRADDGRRPAKSAHTTRKVYINHPEGRVARRLAFVKQAANATENDIELALSNLSQLDGPYFAKSLGLSVKPGRDSDARSGVASLCLEDFCSYRDLTEGNPEAKYRDVLKRERPPWRGLKRVIDFVLGHYSPFYGKEVGIFSGIKNVKGLATILLSAYRDGEDDFHRQNFGVFTNEQGDTQWGRIDFGLGYAETTKIASRYFRNNFLSHDGYSLITLNDLENFPCITDASLFYWPARLTATNSDLNPNSGNRYQASDKALFETLKTHPEFIQEKNEYILKQFLQPLELRRRAILDNVASKEEALELADAVEYRQSSFLMTALASQSVRTFIMNAWQAHQVNPESSPIKKVKDELMAAIEDLGLINDDDSSHRQATERQIEANLDQLISQIKLIDTRKTNARPIADLELSQTGERIEFSNKSLEDKNKDYQRLFASYLGSKIQNGRHLQGALNNILKVRAQAIILKPYHELLISLKAQKEAQNQVLFDITKLLEANQEQVVRDGFSVCSVEPQKVHEFFLIKSEKAKLIRRFSGSLAYLVREQAALKAKPDKLSVKKSHRVEKALLEVKNALIEARDENGFGLAALNKAQLKMSFVPYELKLIEVREKLKNRALYSTPLPVRKIKKILLEENGQKGALSAFFQQQLERETKEHNNRSKTYPFLNHRAAQSYLNILNTCTDFFDQEYIEASVLKQGYLRRRAQRKLQKFKVENRLDSALRHQTMLGTEAHHQIDSMIKKQHNCSIYDIDCLISRLALEAEIVKAEKRLASRSYPAGFSEGSYKALIQAAKGVVKGVAKPTYHEDKSLVDVAQAAIKVAHCLKNPTLENALYCYNHVEKLDLSKKTRTRTVLLACLSGFCLTAVSVTLMAAGLAAVASGVGFLPGIMAMALSVKLALAGVTTLGLGFGGFSAYRFFRDENMMKRKLGNFSDIALKSLEPRSQPEEPGSMVEMVSLN